MRKTFALICFLGLFKSYAQVSDYGLTAKTNISTINKIASDSLNSAAGFGLGFFADIPTKISGLSASLQLGYSQVAYKNKFEPLTFKSHNVEMPLLFYLSSPTGKSRFFGGAVSGMQFSKSEDIPSGSNVNGINTKRYIEKKYINAALLLGVDFQVSKGFNMHIGYNYQLNSTFGKSEIVNKPSHLQVGLQFRFNDFANREVQMEDTTTRVGKPKNLIVLLPTQPTELKRHFSWAYNVDEIQELLMNRFHEHYNATQLYFIPDTALNNWPNSTNLIILGNASTGAIHVNEGCVFVKFGEYFFESERSAMDGLFLINDYFKVVTKPFIGVYKMNFLLITGKETLKEALDVEIKKLNSHMKILN